MKEVQLKRLALKNFKGLKNFEFETNGTTRIYGDNATGKTTLVDAFTWLLFGKDSTGKKDFSVKTFDNENRVIHKIEHEVEGTFSINGDIMTLRRVLKEKWVTKRGTSEPELTGHETIFFWNDVPMKAGEYQRKVDDIILEYTFKLLTSPFYFNSLKWQDRRNILTGIAGDVSDNEIADTREDFSILIDSLGDKTLDEYKKELSAKKKKLKDELKLIPARIDELVHNTPVAHNWEKIEAEIETVKKSIATIDEQLQDVSKVSQRYYDKIQKRQSEIQRLKSQISDKEFKGRKKFKQQLDEKTDAISTAKKAIEKVTNRSREDAEEIKRLQGRINEYAKEQELLRQAWIEENEKEIKFSDDEFLCPTCKRPFEAGDIEAKKVIMTQNFNDDKAAILKDINKQGAAITPRMEELANKIKVIESTNYQAQIEQHEAVMREWENVHLKTVQAILNDDIDYQNLKQQLGAFEKEPEIEKPVLGDNTELKKEKSGLESNLDVLKKELALRDQIEASEKRKVELLEKEKTYAAELSELEQTEFTIEEFTRTKIDMLDTRINGLFGGVKFRLFDTQLNGGLVECCDTLINGVPWQDANNAARINSGIEIINVLSKHYGEIAPMFIDNAEGITDIADTAAQRIELYVSEPDKTLRIA